VKLRYTHPALADLNSILDYIKQHSPGGARQVQARIQRVMNILIQYPNIGLQTEDPAVRRLNTPPYPYLIFYEATETEIIVHAIRHAAREPSSKPDSTSK
jgi:toxin ParE1/3/4